MREDVLQRNSVDTYGPKVRERPITLNISGLRYQIRKSTLEKFPQTLLGSVDREYYYDPISNEYFFERHRQSFDTIIYFYQSGGLINIPSSLNPEILADELNFFRIGDENMNAKLTGRFMREMMRSSQSVASHSTKDTLRHRLWLIFSEPDSSTTARNVHFFDTVVILVAIVFQCIETLPQFHHLKENGGPVIHIGKDDRWDAWLFVLAEIICITWFTLDFFLRLLICPSKKDFFTAVMNWIDFCSILPFYLDVALTYKAYQNYEVDDDHSSDEQISNNLDALMILRIARLLRVLRIVRIFKMSRKFDGLYALGYALKTGASELSLLAVLLTTCVILFSNLVYFANESDDDTPFSSVIDAFWWSVVTMSTVGYGDQVPSTFMAKIVGVVTALTGILVIALPYPIIVTRFNKYYELQKKSKKSDSLFDPNGEAPDFIQPDFSGITFRASRLESMKEEGKHKEGV